MTTSTIDPQAKVLAGHGLVPDECRRFPGCPHWHLDTLPWPLEATGITHARTRELHDVVVAEVAGFHGWHWIEFNDWLSDHELCAETLATTPGGLLMVLGQTGDFPLRPRVEPHEVGCQCEPCLQRLRIELGATS